MHELGLATGVLDAVNKVAIENNYICVNKINVCVGKKAAVIDKMFTEAFNSLKELDEYKLCQNAQIISKLVDGSDVYVDNIEVEEKD